MFALLLYYIVSAWKKYILPNNFPDLFSLEISQIFKKNTL